MESGQSRLCSFWMLLSLLSLTSAQLVKQTWQKVAPEKMRVAAVGPAGVWAVDANDNVFYRVGTFENDGSLGTSWLRTTGKLVQIDVGTNVAVGVNKANQIWMRTGITKSRPQGCGWVRIPGALKHVSVSDQGHIWGVSPDDRIWRRVGANLLNPEGDDWQHIPGGLKQISVGGMGVWGVNKNDQIYYRKGTFGDEDTKGDDWVQVSGKLKYIASGDSSVWGVNDKDVIFTRLGISAANPTEGSWRTFQGRLKQISVWRQTVWGSNVHNDVWTVMS